MMISIRLVEYLLLRGGCTFVKFASSSFEGIVKDKLAVKKLLLLCRSESDKNSPPIRLNAG